jgi:putative Mn2+ efflux pump MntP
MSRAQALALARSRGPGAVAEILVNFVLPYVVYVLLKDRYGDVRALLASSAPPILWSLVELARKRRVDALSLLVIAGIVLSLVAFVGGGSARFLQLRENFVTVFIGLAFLISALVGRPLIYELARAGMQRKPAELAEFESLRDNVFFKRTMLVMTLVWGFGLEIAAALSCALLFAVSIANYLIVSPILNYGVIGVLAIWTAWYAGLQRRKGRARRAAAQADVARAPGPGR